MERYATKRSRVDRGPVASFGGVRVGGWTRGTSAMKPWSGASATMYTHGK